MPIIRVGVQAPQGSLGQVVDLDGPRASVTSITNAGSESVAYSLDSSGTWATLAAGATGGAGVIESGALRLRKVASNGAYPVPVDVTAELYGLHEEGFTAGQVAALQGMVSGAGNLTATYDGSGRMLSLARAGGRRVTIAYPSSTAMVVTEQDVPTPAIITCVTDASGRVTSAAPNW